jgi:Ca2+-binding RTX toxin-like protein
LTVADNTHLLNQADVAALTDGRYVIVWTDNIPVSFMGGNGDVKARIFDPATNRLSAVINVAVGGGDTRDPHVAALPGGGFVVVWDDATGEFADQNLDAVVGRRFDATGAPAGDAFLVNTSTSNFQGDPAIASQPGGRFEIAWSDASGQNTTDMDRGVKGQHFRLPDTSGLLGETTQGTARDDILRGYSLNETFNGAGGDDLIFAGGGRDTVNGGAGLDVLRGEGGDDLLRGQGGDDVIYGGDGNDVAFGGAGANTILGGNGNDRLFGEAGDDRLFGNAGNDLLDGGRGRDFLSGDAGQDRFDFNSILDSRPGDQHDTVVFSRPQHDKIDLRDIDANTHARGNQAFHFIGTAGFSGAEGELRFAGHLLQGDVNGDGRADLEVRIIGAVLAGDVIL